MRTNQVLLIVLVTGFVKCKGLDKNENLKRLNDCGKQMLTVPDGSEAEGVAYPMELPTNEWIVKVALMEFKDNKSNTRPEHALGSFISYRHILTSSQPVMTDHGKWIWNADIKDEEYLNGTNHLKVPIDQLVKNGWKLYVTRRTPENITNPGLPKVKNAWILNVRYQGQGGKDGVDKMRSPMLIELESDVNDVKFPCLVDEDHKLEKDEGVYTYGFSETNRSELLFRRKKFNEYETDKVLLVGKYYELYDRGGPMVSDINNSVTVLGIGASSGFFDRSYDTYFFDIRKLLSDICLFSGICPITPPTTTASPDPSSSTSSEASTSSPDPSAPTSTPSTEPPTLLYTMPTTPPWSIKDRATKASRKPRPPPEHNPEYIVGEEEERYYDSGEPIIVSADFLNGSGEKELIFMMFFVLYGVLYWI